jgi:NCAIR mutase (PurE)-related protein
VRPAELRTLLRGVSRGTVSADQAVRAIAAAPFERLHDATLDHQRALRTGFPEVVFGQGKTPDQVVRIIARLVQRHPPVLATRLDADARDALRAAFPDAEIHDRARLAIVRRAPGARARRVRPLANGPSHAAGRGRGKVLVLCAGTADLPVAEEALLTARTLGSRAELIADVGVAGLHRLLAHRDKLRGARVLVVVAGLEGALPSVVGGLTDRPLIAVPTSVGYGAHFSGLAPLLAMLNSCAAGVLVVNVDNGFGAGYAAHLVNTTGGRT